MKRYPLLWTHIQLLVEQFDMAKPRIWIGLHLVKFHHLIPICSQNR